VSPKISLFKGGALSKASLQRSGIKDAHLHRGNGPRKKAGGSCSASEIRRRRKKKKKMDSPAAVANIEYWTFFRGQYSAAAYRPTSGCYRRTKRDERAPAAPKDARKRKTLSAVACRNLSSKDRGRDFFTVGLLLCSRIVGSVQPRKKINLTGFPNERPHVRCFSC
jgi:hypothetical protein